MDVCCLVIIVLRSSHLPATSSATPLSVLTPITSCRGYHSSLLPALLANAFGVFSLSLILELQGSFIFIYIIISLLLFIYLFIFIYFFSTLFCISEVDG